MTLWAGVLAGALGGWLIEWAIDWWWWRRSLRTHRERYRLAEAARRRLEAELADAQTKHGRQAAEIERLRAEIERLCA